MCDIAKPVIEITFDDDNISILHNIPKKYIFVVLGPKAII